MEKIAQEIPNVSARFFFNDFCGMWETEPELYDIEMLNTISNKWVKLQKTRWNRIGKATYFNHHSTETVKRGYVLAIDGMIEYLRKNPKP